MRLAIVLACGLLLASCAIPAAVTAAVVLASAGAAATAAATGTVLNVQLIKKNGDDQKK